MMPRAWQLGNGKSIPLDRPSVIAILNVTPDSFSDGGDLATPAAAARAALDAIAAGAAMLDIGGESTRPGAARVPAHEQVRRVVPAIRAVRELAPDVPISVDTTLADVAAAAVDAGADAINDVSAGLEDDRLLPVAAERGASLILMHRLRSPERDRFSDRYEVPPDYSDQGGVVTAVREFLRNRAAAAIAAGISPARIVIDPGLGFGKTVEQNVELLRATPEIAGLGFPVLSALSRKSFTARLGRIDPALPPRDRLNATLGMSVAHLFAGARLFRVHDVGPHVQALGAAWGTMPH